VQGVANPAYISRFLAPSIARYRRAFRGGYGQTRVKSECITRRWSLFKPHSRAAVCGETRGSDCPDTLTAEQALPSPATNGLCTMQTSEYSPLRNRVNSPLQPEDRLGTGFPTEEASSPQSFYLLTFLGFFPFMRISDARPLRFVDYRHQRSRTRETPPQTCCPTSSDRTRLRESTLGPRGARGAEARIWYPLGALVPPK
jgi:hypothetical protein